MYKVKFTFEDSVEYELQVCESQIDKFLDAAGENKIYFNDDKSIGFWIKAEKVRYMNIEKIAQDEPS